MLRRSWMSYQHAPQQLARWIPRQRVHKCDAARQFLPRAHQWRVVRQDVVLSELGVVPVNAL